jgi:hypothetical protein|nr:MAG TPA: hypothetical protein [Bacteriophage sp.]
MKRFLICLVLSVMFITPMYSQIQDKFFGCLFGSKMYYMIDAMKDNLYSQKGDKLSVTDVNFGGLSWNYAEMQYFEDQFCAIAFTMISKNKQNASENFNSLKHRLDNKYSLYKITGDSNTQKVVYTDFVNFCSLEYEYSESKGGDMYWYLNLMYWNLELLDKIADSQNSEL